MSAAPAPAPSSSLRTPHTVAPKSAALPLAKATPAPNAPYTLKPIALVVLKDGLEDELE